MSDDVGRVGTGPSRSEVTGVQLSETARKRDLIRGRNSRKPVKFAIRHKEPLRVRHTTFGFYPGAKTAG